MKRKIIEIDEEKCNGCGQCVTGCAEGALQIVDGKAKLVKEQFCDGLGACIGECPTGALKIIERDAEAFDEEEVKRHLDRRKAPAEPVHKPVHGGCPGMQARVLKQTPVREAATGVMPQVVRPELEQWPVMLHLVPVSAPFFKDKDLVLLSTCSSVACPDVQWRYIRGRAVAVACPKLDRTENYVEKLTAIIDANDMKRIYIVRMQVPCCDGLTAMMLKAASLACRKVEIVEVTVGIEGAVLQEKMLN